jgi:hypothetical protein
MSSDTQLAKTMEICESGDEVMMEVNMDSSPRTLHFFVKGKQQLGYVRNLPSSIKFAVSLFLFIYYVVFFFFSLLGYSSSGRT